MDKALVSAVASVALVAALAMSVRWGGLDTSQRSERSTGIAGAIRRLCIIEVSGLVAGLLVGGFGSRLMMRVIAATSSAAAQGRITEAEEVVGRVTSGGTIGLLIFVGIAFGLVGAVAYAIVGTFLPRRAWASGLLFGLLLLGVFARRDPLDPSNKDFTFLSPVPLAIAMIVVLFLLYGTTLVALVARLERVYPPFEPKPRSLVAYIPLALLVLPPFFVAIAAAIVVGAVRGRFPGLGRSVRSGVAHRAGAAALVVATVAGNIWMGAGLVDILS